MQVHLTSIEPDGVVRLATQGALTSAEVGPGTVDPFEKLIGDDWGGQRVVLNLGETDFVDSSAIGWLLTCRRRFKQQGGRLVLSALSPAVKDVFELMRIDTVFELQQDDTAALSAMRDGGA